MNLRRIMVVDDEPNIVSAVQRELNTPPFDDYDYTAEGFTDPLQALERAREVSFEAVISDYRMPVMDGVEFLGRLAQIQPDCMRIVLSGQTDLDALMRLVNEGRIYGFIGKPWQAHQLKMMLAQALDYEGIVAENRRLAARAAARGIALPEADPAELAQVLIVDDDLALLASLSRSLRRHLPVDELVQAVRGEAVHGLTTTQDLRVGIQATPSTLQALRWAEIMNFACVVVDYRMPGMNGVELLEQMAQRQPDCARILISGQIGREDLIQAVNRAHIFAFLEKPWTDFELKTSVLLGLSRHRLLVENRRLAEAIG